MSNDTPLTMERLQHLTYAASVSACMKPEFLKGLAETHPSALIRALATELAALRAKLAEVERDGATTRETLTYVELRAAELATKLGQAEQRAEAAEKDAGRWQQVVKMVQHGAHYNQALQNGHRDRNRMIVSILFRDKAADALGMEDFTAAIDAARGAK